MLWLCTLYSIVVVVVIVIVLCFFILCGEFGALAVVKLCHMLCYLIEMLVYLECHCFSILLCTYNVCFTLFDYKSKLIFCACKWCVNRKNDLIDMCLIMYVSEYVIGFKFFFYWKKLMYIKRDISLHQKNLWIYTIIMSMLLLQQQ